MTPGESSSPFLNLATRFVLVSFSSTSICRTVISSMIIDALIEIRLYFSLMRILLEVARFQTVKGARPVSVSPPWTAVSCWSAHRADRRGRPCRRAVDRAVWRARRKGCGSRLPGCFSRRAIVGRLDGLGAFVLLLPLTSEDLRVDHDALDARADSRARRLSRRPPSHRRSRAAASLRASAGSRPWE